MNEQLITTIKSHGYWRFNFQPLVVDKIESLKQCKEIVEKSKVSLRGWDFPFIPRNNNETMGLEPCGEYYQGWVDVGAEKEFWRMYKSSQYLAYRSLREDWFATDNWWVSLSEKIKPDSSLAVLSSVSYEITECFEFLSRLIQNGLYKEGVRVSLTLINIEGRSLWIDDNNRWPFSVPKITGAQKYKFTKDYSADEIISNSKMIANKIILEVFDCFEWNPSSEQILKDQEKLLTRQF